MILAIAGVALPGGTAAANPDPNWWQDRSVEERQGIVDQYYGVAAQPMPYPAQATLANGSLTHLRETTPEASRSTLGTQVAKDGIAVSLLPQLKRWVPRLVRVSPGAIAFTVAIEGPDLSRWLYTHWGANISDPPQRITVDGAWYAPPGYNDHLQVPDRCVSLVQRRACLRRLSVFDRRGSLPQRLSDDRAEHSAA